jgi:hypothetical protein
VLPVNSGQTWLVKSTPDRQLPRRPRQRLRRRRQVRGHRRLPARARRRLRRPQARLRPQARPPPLRSRLRGSELKAAESFKAKFFFYPRRTPVPWPYCSSRDAGPGLLIGLPAARSTQACRLPTPILAQPPTPPPSPKTFRPSCLYSVSLIDILQVLYLFFCYLFAINSINRTWQCKLFLPDLPRTNVLSF